MSGCSGKCCAVFNYPATPEELRKREDRDSQYIADMLVPLTTQEAHARSTRFEIDPPEGFDLLRWAEAGPTYTCRHWNEETRLCEAYEDRPVMCREYPYAAKCQHDCSCDFMPDKHIINKWGAIRVRQCQPQP